MAGTTLSHRPRGLPHRPPLDVAAATQIMKLRLHERGNRGIGLVAVDASPAKTHLVNEVVMAGRTARGLMIGMGKGHGQGRSFCPDRRTPGPGGQSDEQSQEKRAA